MHYPTMHMPWQRQSWTGSETNGWMALTWALLAFFGGALLGMTVGKKKGFMLSRMMGAGGGMGGGTGGGMPLWKHHHHGYGQPSCHMRHETTGTVAPGAVDEKPHERDEGE